MLVGKKGPIRSGLQRNENGCAVAITTRSSRPNYDCVRCPGVIVNLSLHRMRF